MYSTHIAAIKSTGNMFSYEAIEELNIKPKSFRDLLTDEPYQRKDLIIVQDPALTDKFNLNSFHHIKNKLKVDDEGKYVCESTVVYVHINCLKANFKTYLNGHFYFYWQP